jgi:hypothetical protein
MLNEIHALETLPSSALASEPHFSRAPAYAHIKTSDIAQLLRDEFDMLPVSSSERRVRRSDKQGYQRHLVKFRRSDLMHTDKPQVPELLVLNAHDGSFAAHLWTGYHRFACANGLVVCTSSFGKVSVPHRGDAWGKIIDGVYRVIDNANEAERAIENWSGLDMPWVDQLSFANEAVKIRYDDPNDCPVNLGDLLLMRRSEDQGSDLWRVFNRVQEHLIRGGLVGRNSEGERRTMRRIKSPERDVGINSALWQLADQYAQTRAIA